MVTSCSTNNFQYVLVLEDGNTDPLTPSWGDLTESDLDLEWSMSVARNAQIVFVNAPVVYDDEGYVVAGGVWQAWYYAVDNTTAPVISMSYGNCEFGDNNVLTPTGQPGADETELMKANSEGITFMNSSGDSGAAECDPLPQDVNNLAQGGLAVGYPASSPEVTGVGGTAIAYPNGFSSTYWATSNNADGDGGSAQNPPLPETSWNDDQELVTAYGNYPTGTQCTVSPIPSGAQGWQECYAIVASGGGPSNCAEQNSDDSECVSGFPQPSWQTVTIPNQTVVRFSPDVALAASPNFPGYIFCTPQESWVQNGQTTSTCSPGGPTGIQNAIAFSDDGNATPSLVGGTSASTPVFAGIVTLINQYLAGSSSAGLGNINPTLYELAQSSAAGAFHQITTGNNTVYCQAGYPKQPWPEALVCPANVSSTVGSFGYQASNADSTTGYNLVTGLGSVDANKLAVAWTELFSLSAGAPASVPAGQNTTASVRLTPGSGFTGTVSLSCSGLPSGANCSAATLSGSSLTAQLTITTPPDLAAGTSTITITGSDATTGLVATTTTSLTVTGTTESYSVSSNLTNGTMTVTQGQTGTANLAVSSTTGFINSSTNSTVVPVTYSCTGLPAESACQFNGSPAPVSTSATAITLTVTTTAPTSNASRGVNLFSAVLLPGLLGIVFVAGARKRSFTGMGNGMRMLGLILVLGASTLWLGSCGGSSSSGGGGGNTGTPVGSSTVTVSASTGGAAPVTGSPVLTFTLTVGAAAQ